MTSTQELYGRRGHIVTDATASDITRVEELAYDLRIDEVMTTEVKTIAPDAPMTVVLELLRNAQISGLPIVKDERVVGIVSLEDLIRAMTAMDMNSPVRKYMSPEVITVVGAEPIIKALETFARYKVGRLPVVDQENRLIGMITKGDLTRGILIALQRDYHSEEIRRYRASHLFEDISSDRTSIILRYRILPRDFNLGGNASSMIKRALLRLGANPQIARRCGIAIYEAEMNLVIHTTDGGMIKVEIEPNHIKMQAIDTGPGIADINLAMQAGFSTASEEVREMGFGAGMGLVNIQRCVDKMELESQPGQGTKLVMKIHLDEQLALRDA